MHRKGTWSPGRSTHNHRVCKGREGGWVTCRQSANGEIKEDIPYIYPLGREHAKESLFQTRWKQRGEALHCWRGRDNAVQPQSTGHALITPSEFQWGGLGPRTPQGDQWMQKLLLWKWCCTWKLGAAWVPMQKAREQQLDEKLDLKVDCVAVQQGSCVALSYGTLEAISSYDHYILRLKHPGKVGHWL